MSVVVVLVVVVVVIVVGGGVVRIKSVRGLIGNGVEVTINIGGTVLVVKIGIGGGKDGVVDGSGKIHEQGQQDVVGVLVVVVEDVVGGGVELVEDVDGGGGGGGSVDEVVLDILLRVELFEC